MSFWRSPTKEDRDGEELVQRTIPGREQSDPHLQAVVSEEGRQRLLQFVSIATQQACEAVISALKKDVMALDRPALAGAGLEVLDACVMSTVENGQRGNNFVSAFKVDKWAGRIDQILSGGPSPQLQLLVLGILGRWATVTCTDNRWGTRARGAEGLNNLQVDPFVLLVKKYQKRGLNIPLPQNAPPALAGLGGGSSGRPAAMQQAPVGQQPMYGSQSAAAPQDNLPIGEVIAVGAEADRYMQQMQLQSGGVVHAGQAQSRGPSQAQIAAQEEEQLRRALQESIAMIQAGQGQMANSAAPTQSGPETSEDEELRRVLEMSAAEAARDTTLAVTSAEQEMSDTMAQMGFTDHARNISELRAQKGALERTVDKLFNAGYTEPPLPGYGGASSQSVNPELSDAFASAQSEARATGSSADLLSQADDLLGPAPAPAPAPAAASSGPSPFEEEDSLVHPQKKAPAAAQEHQFWTEGDLYESQKPAAMPAAAAQEDLASMLGVQEQAQEKKKPWEMPGAQPTSFVQAPGAAPAGNPFPAPPVAVPPPAVVAPPPAVAAAPPPEPDDDGESDDDMPEPVMLGGSSAPAGFATHKEALQAFFAEHKPENIDKIDKLLSGYKGREETLFQKLTEKYGVAPVWPQGIPYNDSPSKGAKTPPK